MTKSNEKTSLLLGFHNHLPSDIQKNNTENDLSKNHINFQIGLVDLLNNFQKIKTTIHFSSNSIAYLDKKFSNFSSNIRSLLERNQLELFSGGLYEPIFSFTPKEDRETQILLMNRLLNHTFGYTPYGAWITELSWEPSFAIDLAKSRIQYTCLPKEYFIHAGLEENEISGYYLTEEEGRKIAVFPISHDLNDTIKQYSPQEFIDNLLKSNNSSQKKPFVLFYKDGELDTDINKLNWLSDFFKLLEENTEHIETKLFNEYFTSNKPKGRTYLPTIQDIKPLNTTGHWKHFLLKYNEINLLHKKMLRVSKKINSAKEGKSRFKVIKDMISQAQDLLLKGQSNDAYWNNNSGGIYSPQERHKTYSHLIKAENLIDAASRQGSKWIQVYELDYDCDGHDEIIIETETQNIYISPINGGTILEHDFRPKNINIANVITRKKEPYHNGNTIFDQYQRLNLIEHFFKDSPSLEKCIKNEFNHLTNEVILPYSIEKIKAKEETCKVTFNTNINLIKLENNPQIELKKQISIRSGDSSLIFDYSLTNKSSSPVDFIYGIEFNLNITPNDVNNCYFYLEGNKNHKTSLPDIKSSEEIKETRQISVFNKTLGIDIALSWNKPCNLFRYPIESFSFIHKKLENTYQGTSILPTWHVTLEPNVPWELSIKQDINSATEEL